MGQMIACVGQQAVDGQRIPLGFTDRTLPHFHKYDDGAAARGFVESSFMKGLNPTEFFFHAMGGREGLIDTAVKTSETGYIQRKLIKGLEDARIVADNTVRNANGTIIQFLYGEDGFDGGRIEKQKIITIGKNNDKIIADYSLNIDTLKGNVTDEIYTYLTENIAEFNAMNSEFIRRLLNDRDYYFENFFKGTLSNEVHYPINIKRLLSNTIRNFENLPFSDLNPIYISRTINNLVDDLQVSANYKGSELLGVLCRIYLSPKKLCVEHKLSKIAFDFIISNIKAGFYDAIAENGELVGTIAAQSIGEPSTQMTLNTFHFAGVASKSSVNQGVPRFKELLSVTSNLKAPMNNIMLKEPYCYNKEYAQKVLNELPLTSIKQITKSTEIFFDPKSSQELSSKNSDDDKLLKIYKIFEELNPLDPDSYRSPWVLKLEFNKAKMMDKNIKMADIHYAIISKFNIDQKDVSCFYTDDNSDNLIMRIQCNLSHCDDENTEDNCDEEDIICILKTIEKTILNEIILSGIKNIKNASMEPNENFINFNEITGKYEKKTRWEIYTSGSNLEDILIHPSVDAYNTTSNHIWEIYDIFGIEAARKMLYTEISDVFEMSGSYVNSRHIALLVDIITNRGALMSIDRHGINKSDRGPLAKCSFEETPDIIARAAIFGELDKVRSVSANIMLGQEVPIGTGAVDILFDEEKYFENLLPEVEEVEEEDTDDLDNKDSFVNKYCDNLF